MIRKDILAIHSIGEFVLAVPAMQQAEHFYESFGLTLTALGNHLEIRTAEGGHRWGRIVETNRKYLHHLSFNCFDDDLERFKAHLEKLRVRLVDPPQGFESDGLWFRGHDDVLMQIRVGPKTSPDQMSLVDPPVYRVGTRNAPYRSRGGKIEIQRLSHILMFTPDVMKTVDFYTTVLGMRLTDYSGDGIAFLHGVHGSDHHMIALAKSERRGFQHASWIVPSIDAVGLGAMQMADHGYRFGWGTGRHVLGSNYFHYVRDPWGSYCEYACGIDFIPASMEWQAINHLPEDSFYLWGPDVPPEFVTNYE